MESSIKHTIQKLLNDVLSFASNDVLVDLSATKAIWLPNEKGKAFSLPVDSQLLKLIKDSELLFRESGVRSLCLAEGILEWEQGEKKKSTPLFLKAISYSHDKIRNLIHFTMEEDILPFFNPYLDHYFTNEFEKPLPDFNADSCSLQTVEKWFFDIGFQGIIKDDCCIANFHHHRFQLVKDLEGLLHLDSLSPNVLQIAGGNFTPSSFKLDLTGDLLFPADVDQLMALEQINVENTVIQGPPGTGKSQVLTNLLGKLLYQQSPTLVVSEKRVALEVLQKKLSLFSLDDFAFITHTNSGSKELIASLKATWEMLEKTTIRKKEILPLSTQYLQQLQRQLDLLNQQELIGEVSFSDFQDLITDLDFSKGQYSSHAPSIKEYLIDEETIKQLYQSDLQTALSFLPFEVIRNHSFTNFDQQVKGCMGDWKELSAHFQLEFSHDVQEAMKKAAICQVIENETNKAYFKVLQPESKEQKRFLQLKKKYASLQKEQLQFSDDQNSWLQTPSLQEAEQLLSALQNGSYLLKRKAKRRLKSLLVSTFVLPIPALENCIAYLQFHKERQGLHYEFQQLGIQEPSIEIDAITLLIQQLKSKDWVIFKAIEATERTKLCEYHSRLNHFNSVLKTYFSLSPSCSLSIVFSTLESQLEDLLRMHDQLKKLHKSSFLLLREQSTFEGYCLSVFKSNWVKFESQFPILSYFSPQDLKMKIDAIISFQTTESKEFAHQIIARFKQQFDSYHELLRTPASKLNALEKTRKQELRKGKAILVKEFSKTRNHPSIRELFQSEAAVWIQLLKPIWLSNPSETARCFPLKQGLFDVLVFDEASQLTFAHALGSIERGKRIVVAGDEQQMAPSFYFQHQSSELTDLLHQAAYYWKNTLLRHHYRSAHPSLIAFSNQHFYNNELIAFPSGNALNYPVHLHYCPSGRFENRINSIEAEQICKLIEQYVLDNKSIGVIAFSETQLNCIREKLSPTALDYISERTLSGDVFFKTLENVQGEECDHLLISLGYAKNSEGDFQLRFGPLNQQNGSKRLNVLLTRARYSIDFFTSVRSNDFKISSNEGVNLLRLWLSFIEKEEEHTKEIPRFPHFPQVVVNQATLPPTLKFKHIYATLPIAQELVTFQQVLEQRNWTLLYS